MKKAELTLYHNPRCSKSREALSLLETACVKPKIVEYLKEPLSEAELLSLMEKLQGPLEAIVRSKEESFKEHPFSLTDKQTIARELSRHPELMERPVLVKGDKAVIGRPPEKVKELL